MSKNFLVDQRIRNRLFEYIEWVSESAHSAPELGLNELLNQWEGFICRPIGPDQFPSPVYSIDEIQALRDVDVAWEQFCDATPASIVDVEAALATPQWGAFVSAARDAVEVFSRRGRQSEEVELCV